MNRYILPLPTSVNNLFVEVVDKRTGKPKRIKTREYAAWRDEAGWSIKQQRQPKVIGPTEVHIYAVKPDNRARDLDNLLKGILDVLGSKHGVGVIEDDSLVQRIVMEWVSQGDPLTVLVGPWIDWPFVPGRPTP